MRYTEKFTIAEVENMMPWEKDIYINLLMQKRKQEQEMRESYDQ